MGLYRCQDSLVTWPICWFQHDFWLCSFLLTTCTFHVCHEVRYFGTLFLILKVVKVFFVEIMNVFLSFTCLNLLHVYGILKWQNIFVYIGVTINISSFVWEYTTNACIWVLFCFILPSPNSDWLMCSDEWNEAALCQIIVLLYLLCFVLFYISHKYFVTICFTWAVYVLTDLVNV